MAVAAAAAVVAAGTGCRARLHRLDGAEQHAAEALDGGQLVLGGVEVDGGHRERDLDGVRRSSRAAWRESALASAASSTSNIADGLVGEVALRVDEPGVAEGGGGGAGELRLEQRPERAEHLPQLVVAHPPVDRDQPAHEVEGLQGDVAAQVARPRTPGDAAAHLLEGRA